MLKKTRMFLFVNILMTLYANLSQASQSDDDRFPPDSQSKPTSAFRRSFENYNLQRSTQRVVKYEISPAAKFFVDCYNATSLFGDTIDLNDLHQFKIKSLIRKNDTRQAVVDITQHPYRNIGLITVYDPIKNRTYGGTGGKISETHILTAAHNVVGCKPYKRLYKVPHYWSAFNDGEFLGEAPVKKIYVPEDYCNGGCDWAILELAYAVQPKTFLPYGFVPEDELTNQNIHVIGYPGDFTEKRNPDGQPLMVEDTGEILQVGQYEFTHDANTHQGSSGAPVILDRKVSVGVSSNNGADSPIVGVHVRGPSSDRVEYSHNYATFINKEHDDIVNQILAGKKPDGMDEFIVREGE